MLLDLSVTLLSAFSPVDLGLPASSAGVGVTSLSVAAGVSLDFGATASFSTCFAPSGLLTGSSFKLIAEASSSTGFTTGVSFSVAGTFSFQVLNNSSWLEALLATVSHHSGFSVTSPFDQSLPSQCCLLNVVFPSCSVM